jgi:hypothetical protein
MSRPKSIKIRKTWGDMRPVTKVIPNKKKIKRKTKWISNLDFNEGQPNDWKDW